MRQAPALLFALAIALPAASPAADLTKTVRLTQDATHPFAVENLAGAMHVSEASGAVAEVAATIHAESPSVLEGMTLEPTTDEKGRPSLRVRYPQGESRICYPRGDGNSDMKYGGRRIKVSRDSGVVAWADLEVKLPKGVHEAWVRNGIGRLDARGITGTVRLDAASGDITVSDSGGDILADTGSGNVKASDLRGTFKCDTGSGDCDVTGFRGDDLSLDTGSGSLRASDVTTGRLKADTGSGDVKVARAEADEIKADTGSGNVDLEAVGTRLRSVKADTGSGNVRLRLAADASFEARADMGSGDIRSGYPDAEPILRRREVVGYRRGDGRIKIDVDTGSGDVVLEPAR